MNKSINQIRVELSKIVTGDNPVTNVKTGHLQLYSYFWGDFLRAYKEQTLNYPVMGAFYPNGSLLRNQTQIQLTIYIADKLYKDWSNLNDIESDTLQICRDVFNVINHSTRWNKIGRVQSCSVNKFIQKGGDEVAGHEMVLQFLIRDSESICGLPIIDYDFDQITGDGCSPVQIYENGVLVATVESGGIYEYSHGNAHYVITNSIGGILYSGDIAENDTLTQAISDSTAVLKDTEGNILSTNTILAQASEDIEAPNSSLSVNGNPWGEIPSGGSLNLLVTDTASNPVGTFVVDDVVIANSVVEINGVEVADLLAETSAQINVTLNGVQAGTWNGVDTWEIEQAAAQPIGMPLMKTGQTVSYATGDDGDLERGRLTDFYTLPGNNPFGNNKRFTGTTGGYQLGGSYFDAAGVGTTSALAFPNDIVIDWSTFATDLTSVLGYRRTFSGSNIDWSTAISGANALSIGSYTTGWSVTNRNELESLMPDGGITTSFFNFNPFNLTADLNIWTSTTHAITTANAIFLGSTGNGNFGNVSKAIALGRYLPCRQFTVSGTTLT